MQSRNPALASDVFSHFDAADSRSTTMTVAGTAIKGIVLLGLALATAAITWIQFEKDQSLGPIMPWFFGSMIGALVIGIGTYFKPHWAPFTAPLYCCLQGVVLGTLSVIAELKVPGVVMQALFATFATFLVMMGLYTSRAIRVTPAFVKIMATAVLAIMLTYVIAMVMSLFGATVPYLHQPNPIGIGISVVIVGVAALTLLLDFNQIEELTSQGAPKSMEWYGAFSLMVGLFWLYIEILRLLTMISQYAGSD